MADRQRNEGQEPLRPVIFALLLSLGEADRHGYAIMQRVNQRLGHRAIVGPGTLYRNLKELRERGWIAHVEGPVEADARRQYYTLTTVGRRAAAAEAARMAELVDAARVEGILPHGSRSA